MTRTKKELIELKLDQVDDETRAKLFTALRANGLQDGVCTACTRPYLSRSTTSRLCPPCRSGNPDGWCPAFTARFLETGQSQPDPTRAVCPECKGLGVVGWTLGGPHSPRCEACGGRGQVAGR